MGRNENFTVCSNTHSTQKVLLDITSFGHSPCENLISSPAPPALTLPYWNTTQPVLHGDSDSDFDLPISSKELNLIMKLHQKDYQPKWETIAETFENRSMNQIKDMLHYFGKTQSMPEFFDTVSLDANNDKPVNLNHLSMFLTPREQKNLTNATKDATIKPKKSQSG